MLNDGANDVRHRNADTRISQQSKQIAEIMKTCSFYFRRENIATNAIYSITDK